MNLPPEFIPLKARVTRKRRGGTVNAPPPPPPAGLAVVGVNAVSVIGPELEMNVVFNTTASDPMVDPTAADPTKWTARYQGQKYVGSLIAGGDFDFLYLQLTPIGAEAGPDILNYANAPSDVSDSLGRFLAAFAGFALP
jgi:hypothetical protein